MSRDEREERHIERVARMRGDPVASLERRTYDAWDKLGRVVFPVLARLDDDVLDVFTTRADPRAWLADLAERAQRAKHGR
ncbi:MAG TPA: hypothetical protein VGS01_09675 [Candidatus Limnocylindria bacterium]|jgi:hypothetical protein|nr:hypothetical protein [Candidatus Limnocylindria bacterium]